MTTLTREQALSLDGDDVLAPLRDQFDLPDSVIYLDGNSLGVLPRATAARVQQVVQREWGADLIRSWNSAGWIALPQRIGDKIATLVGAGPGQLVVADSTSVNLFKVLAAALAMVAAGDSTRRVILSERSNFPTDLYIAQALAAERGFTLELAQTDDLAPRLGRGDVAVLMLTHVNYRSGRMLDMAGLSAAAHSTGALAIWDLAHSAGAVPVELLRDGADFAIGCGYKYLNGGPGAPAFVWVHPRHVDAFQQPLAGWMGHAAPFEFVPGYRPAAGISRYLCGTPAVLAMAALECGVDTVLAAAALAVAAPGGGMALLRRKSLALTGLFAQQVQALCPGVRSVTPVEDAQRGSQVSLTLSDNADAAYAVMQALIARGVIGDYRAGDATVRTADPASPDALDILRFGFTPLYTRFVDAWDAAQHLHDVLAGEEWRRPEFSRRLAVT